ncbi:MAG TPA: DUF4232 domain-containing protein [Streptosporangiaceae bacterium]|nr:DUF4232 domain-containing protein [Streptosporangiaceae bacterium]
MGSAVTKYGHIAGRVIAVVAFAGTAALAVTLSRAPARPDHAALSSNLTLSQCATSGLQAWLGLAQAPGSTSITGTTGRFEASGTYYTLEFTNVSARVCSLYGYPDVSAYAGDQADGTQIGSAAAHDTSVRPRPVTLAPGQTAHSVLRVTSIGTFEPTACAQVTAPELRVTPPDQIRPAFVPIHLTACSKKGLEFMSVQAIQPRPGVPGFAVP